MNYDEILAIFNCFKDKIKYFTPKVNIKNEIPEDVKQWYEDWKKVYDIVSNEDLEKHISPVKEGDLGEFCVYYITQREQNVRVVTNGSGKEKIMASLVGQAREQMVKETIYKYLATVLNGIEILPFDVKKLDDKSVYECKATGNASERIRIDYDDDKLTTCIKITAPNKQLKISMLPEIISTRYDGMVTLSKTKEKSSKSIFNLFRKKSKFELEHQDTADFISITKDEINSTLNANGTVYADEGVYVYGVKENIFMISYFDQETINTLLTTNFKKRFELNVFIRALKDKKELASTDFIRKLEKYGLLPNATFSIPGTSKELQVLVNKAFNDSRTLVEELFKTNKIHTDYDRNE